MYWLNFSGQKCYGNPTLQVDIVKKTFIKDFKATGNLEMTFLSNFDIQKDWVLKTETMLVEHKWTKTGH